MLWYVLAHLLKPTIASSQHSSVLVILFAINTMAVVFAYVFEVGAIAGNLDDSLAIDQRAVRQTELFEIPTCPLGKWLQSFVSNFCTLYRLCTKQVQVHELLEFAKLSE